MTTCELLVQQVVTHAASKDPGKRTGLVSSTMRIPQIVVYANHGPNKGNAEYWISSSMCGSCRLWASDCCRSGVARTASDLYNIYSTKVLEKGDARTRRSYEEDIYHRMGSNTQRGSGYSLIQSIKTKARDQFRSTTADSEFMERFHN